MVFNLFARSRAEARKNPSFSGRGERGPELRRTTTAKSYVKPMPLRSQENSAAHAAAVSAVRARVHGVAQSGEKKFPSRRESVEGSISRLKQERENFIAKRNGTDNIEENKGQGQGQGKGIFAGFKKLFGLRKRKQEISSEERGYLERKIKALDVQINKYERELDRAVKPIVQSPMRAERLYNRDQSSDPDVRVVRPSYEERRASGLRKSIRHDAGGRDESTHTLPPRSIHIDPDSSRMQRDLKSLRTDPNLGYIGGEKVMDRDAA